MYIGLQREVIAYYDGKYIRILNQNSGSFRILSRVAAVLVYLLKGCRKIEDVRNEFCYLCDSDSSCFNRVLKNIDVYLGYHASEFQCGINKIKKEELAMAEPVKDVLLIPQPENVFIRTTNFCDKDCKYCSEKVNLRNGTPSCFSIGLTENLLKDMNVEKTCFELTGGEPLLCSDLETILDLFARSCVSVSIITKATGNYNYFKRIIRKNINNVCFSLDSDIPEYVDYITNRKNTFSHIIECVKIAKQEGIQVDINAVLTSQNINNIERFTVFCIEAGISVLHFTIVYSTSDIDKKLLLDKEERQRVFDIVNNCIEKYQNLIKIELTSTNSDEAARCIGCGKALTDVKISSDGVVSLCNGYVIGDLNSYSLYEIWNSDCARRARNKLMDQMAVCQKK